MSQTPLMTQFYQIKKENPDTLLLFRVGDFFETFDKDAEIASKVLGIVLTKRANGKAGHVPLAGFPHHAIDTYLPKLIRAGFRVAICEQVENPKLAKGLVKREVVEVVTPGVVFSDKLLEHNKNNYLLALHFEKETVGLSFADVSTGEFYAYEVHESKLDEQFSLINPAEILISKESVRGLDEHIRSYLPGVRITKTEEWFFEYDFAFDLLTEHFKVKTLKGFGLEKFHAGVIAAGVVLKYLLETQRSNLSHLNKISLYNPSDYMALDLATKRNLEIMQTLQDGTREGTLIQTLDNTKTPMGGRMLKKWISAPLTDLVKIRERLDSVENFVKEKSLRENLQNELREISDLERLISRVSTGRANPRELVNLKNSLKKIPLINQLLDQAETSRLKQLNEELSDLDALVNKIEIAINDEPPINVNDGGIIREGYSAELDELRDIKQNAKKWIAKLQAEERERTGIPSLKVGFNKVFGYYIEISNAHKSKVPPEYIRKQTLVNGERFITPALKEYEEKILNAQEKIEEIEFTLFDDVRKTAAKFSREIQRDAAIIAELDCYLSFAQSAAENNYVKPELDDGTKIEITKGRHPVIEKTLPPGEKFTPNDLLLDNKERQIIILTGPNMAGKSVYLRQTGLIVLLAQAGSFVPAETAHIGIVDRIFTRVGASDNIAAGESTFLVEMHETANILNNATPKSLILLDEIGRGTSTFDGISIAWAITEYLHENPNVAAKTLFATHYHELNEMANLFPRIKNMRVEVREYGDKIIFLHKVSEGYADHSYGIQVAQMAGLPPFVTKRAKEILNNLEGKELTPYEFKKKKQFKKKEDELQYTLFEFKDDEIRKEISEIPIDEMTPIDALNKLNELKKKIKEDEE